jgi:hypothetical protein
MGKAPVKPIFRRKIIQYVGETETHFPVALCNDGTLWHFDIKENCWKPHLLPIPQEEV